MPHTPREIADDTPSEIADEICGWLGQHRSARRQVLRRMVILRRTTRGRVVGRDHIGGEWHAVTFPAIDLDRFRAQGKRAQKIVRDIRDFFGDPDDLRAPAELRKVAAQAKARRRDQLPRFCAYEACDLIEKFSTEKPVGTKDKNAHVITQLLYKAVTGNPGSEASCLKAVKSVIACRRPSKTKR
jgi:hypothetical protein